jgi:hypothetical protein
MISNFCRNAQYTNQSAFDLGCRGPRRGAELCGGGYMLRRMCNVGGRAEAHLEAAHVEVFDLRHPVVARLAPLGHHQVCEDRVGLQVALFPAAGAYSGYVWYGGISRSATCRRSRSRRRSAEAALLVSSLSSVVLFCQMRSRRMAAQVKHTPCYNQTQAVRQKANMAFQSLTRLCFIMIVSGMINSVSNSTSDTSLSKLSDTGSSLN